MDDVFGRTTGVAFAAGTTGERVNGLLAEPLDPNGFGDLRALPRRAAGRRVFPVPVFFPTDVPILKPPDRTYRLLRA